MTYQSNYSYKMWTAFREADLLGAGDYNINKGDKFVMPGKATVTLASYDNDSKLSGDNNEHATDSTGQNGWVHDGSKWTNIHGDLYVEQTWVLHGSDGKTYTLAEIEGSNGHNAAGNGDDYFSFVGGTPPAGVTLTVGACHNVTGDGISYGDLSATPSAKPVNNAPTFDNLPANGILHMDENNTSVIDINASDADGDNLTYEIVGGRDNAFFEIDAHTGQLSFKNAPDFENPNSGGNNNTYDVTVKVTDGNGGSQTKALWVKVQDVDEAVDPACIVIEAETMSLHGFNVQHGSNASGGELVRLNHLGGTGDISTKFEGPSGNYDLTVFAQDESDGQSNIMVKVNGVVVDAIVLDNDNNGGGSNNGHFSEFTIQDIELQKGDTVTLWVDGDAGEYVRIDKIKLMQDDKDCPEGFLLLDFEGQDRGTVIEEQFEGVTITAQRATHNTAANDAMIFDSNNPTGGDHDLGYDNQGNILIISEDNDSHDPDDAVGGTFTFEFDNPSDVHDIKLLDIEEAGGTIDLFDANGDLIKSIDIPARGNNSIQTIAIDATGVAEMEINLAGSGAIDDLCWKPGEPVVVVPASVAGTYFMDNNDNSVQDAGDMAVAGATVQLFKDGQFVASTTTDADGNYLFADVEPGTGYSVRFIDTGEGKTFVDGDQGGDDTVDSDVVNVGNAGNGNTAQFDLAAGENKTDIDGGIEDPGTASLAGRVFMDNNDNSVDDAGDMGVAGVTVTLSNGQTTVTDANGNYEFTGLKAGDYTVTFPTQFEGKTLVDSNAGGDDTIDSDADEGTGSTGTISLGIGERSEDNDAGLETVDTGDASLAGRVFMDSDDDNQDNGEMGVAGVTVTLLDATGAAIATTTTGNDGSYEFTGLAAGTYSVEFPTVVDGKVLVDSNVGPDATDSDANQTTGQTGQVTLGIGERSEDNDAGIEDPGTASVGNLVFLDNDGNGRFNAGDERVEGVTVELLDENGATVATTTTNANGQYLFSGLNAGVYSVLFTAPDGLEFTTEGNDADDVRNNDSDANVVTGATDQFELSIGERERDIDAGLVASDTGDAAINGRVFMDNNDNNQDDAGDMGVAGVTVTLLDENGAVIATTTTGADGSYSFGGLDAGTYSVEFPTTVDGKVLVDSNVGPDATDSDADQATGTTGPIVLGIGEVSNNNDAGVEDPGTASIGDKVFLDENGNGQQDAGEAGVNGVAVTLFNAAGQPVATTTTTNGGMYLFDGLDAGDYSVGFEAPDGFELTDSNVGNDGSDSDADQATGRTDTISLEIGEDDRSVDAGLVEINTNTAPTPADDDAGKACADQDIKVDVLANDTDADGDALAVTAVNGQAIAEGQTINVDGVDVMLMGGSLVFNGEAAFESLNVGEEASVTYTYTVSDGQDTGTASVDVTYCGVAETIQDICASLPDSGTYQLISDVEAGGSDAWTIRIDGTGDARFDGLEFEAAYCVSLFQPVGFAADFGSAPSYAADLYCTDDTAAMQDLLAGQTGINGQSAVENLDLINWILNQEFSENGYTDSDVQSAIWGLTDGIAVLQPGSDQANVDEIIALAEANGEGFEAGPGGIVGLVVDPNPDTVANSQPFIVGIDFNDLDCLC